MKILFAYPPSLPMLREDRCQVPRSGLLISPSLPPLDLLTLAAVAEQAGGTSRVEDYSGEGNGMVRFREDLRSFEPDHLVVTVTTPTLEADLAACAEARSLLPGLNIIAKGAHFLSFHETILEAHPYLDMIIRGEAEDVLAEILAGRERDEIAGLTWRNGRQVIHNPGRAELPDLDRLPFPARHLVDNEKYRRLDNGRVQGVVRVSRGCPYHCFYCLATPLSGRTVRMRSPDNIVSELRHCVADQGIRDFVLWSDVFSLDRSWVRDLAAAIAGSGLDIRWSANMRADTVDAATVRAMRRAGCELVSMGIESGNQSLLDHVGKRTSLGQVREAVSILRRSGISTLGYFLVGLPWETRQTAEETVRFAIDLDCDFANFFCATPLPGTRFFDYALSSGLLERGTADGTGILTGAYGAPSIGTHHLCRDEVEALHRSAVRRFHLRPQYLLKRFSRLSSVRELSAYVRAGWTMARDLRMLPAAPPVMRCGAGALQARPVTAGEGGQLARPSGRRDGVPHEIPGRNRQ